MPPQRKKKRKEKPSSLRDDGGGWLMGAEKLFLRPWGGKKKKKKRISAWRSRAANELLEDELGADAEDVRVGGDGWEWVDEVQSGVQDQVCLEVLRHD